MALNRSEPGIWVSAVLHTLALFSALVVFSNTEPLIPAEEAISIDVIIENPTNQVTKGERSAKEVTTPKQRAERVAETLQERDPGEAKKDVVSPPTRPPEMKVDTKPVEAVTPPPPPLRPRIVEETKAQPAKSQTAKSEPAKSEPVKSEPAKSEPIKPQKTVEKKPEPNRQELAKLVEQAELEAKQQEQQTQKEQKDKEQRDKKRAEDKRKQEQAEAEAEKKQAEQERVEQAKQELAEKELREKQTAEKEAAKQKQLKADAAAKAAKDALAKEAKLKALAKAKADAEAKAAREAALANQFNAGDIRKLLQSKEASQSTGSTGREVQRTASLGTATASGAKLSPSLRGQLVGMLQDQMQKCYSPPLGVSGATATMPLLDIRLNQDGSLMSEPRILRAGNTSVDRAVADAAVRAVRRCAPYRVPTQFVPYFNDWKLLNVEFEIPSI